MKTDIKIRQIKNRIFLTVVVGLTLLAVLPLFFTLGFLLYKGITVLNFRFLISLPAPLGESGGGILNAIVGSFILIILATIFSVPLGLSAGIYLAEAKDTKLAYYLRLCVEIMQGIPSIVIGVIAYAWLVLPLKSFSALSGGVALAMMMLPLIVRTTEETLLLIPHSLKEASLALGVPYSRTVLKVVVPAGLSGITTGVLLGIARIAGETAPLLFTAFGSPFLSANIAKPIESLPHLIFNYATSPYEEWHRLAWGASFILICGILSLNLLAKVVAKRWKVQF